jgi:hypothetical protein
MLRKTLVETRNQRKKLSPMKKSDARRLKRNLSYMVHMYCGRPFDELKTAAKAALEHHFNNHKFCSGWCPYLAKSEAERAEVQYKYCSKTDDSVLYSQCVEIHEAYTTEQGLRNKGCMS